jgi:putative two-component system response regulator
VREFTRLLLKQVAVDCPEYGLDSARIKMIAEASPLHDVGKIAISDTILLKPGRLTTEEFEVMKTHTTKGYDIIKNMTDMDDGEYLQCCAEIARSHHEKYDGKGYPDGLKGDEIPISAQIVSVADVYDALISERCYKKAYLKNVAFEMILRGECGVFNPKIMESFAKLKDEFEMLADKLQ